MDLGVSYGSKFTHTSYQTSSKTYWLYCYNIFFMSVFLSIPVFSTFIISYFLQTWLPGFLATFFSPRFYTLIITLLHINLPRYCFHDWKTIKLYLLLSSFVPRTVDNLPLWLWNECLYLIFWHSCIYSCNRCVTNVKKFNIFFCLHTAWNQCLLSLINLQLELTSCVLVSFPLPKTEFFPG